MYVQFRDLDTGKRLTAVSSHETSRGRAESWAIEQLRKGVVTSKANMSFSQFAEDWWTWGQSMYIEKKHAKGLRLSRGYADNNKRILEKYILPNFGATRLSKITPALLEDFQMSLTKSEPDQEALLPKTVNNIFTILRVMLREAFRLGYIPTNPAFAISDLMDTSKQKGFLNQAEFKLIFDPSRIEEIWKDFRHYTLNQLAAMTGARMGEIQALQIKDVHENYIDINKSWDRKYGPQDPKWGSFRKVRIPEMVHSNLAKIIANSPYPDPDDLVFWGKDGRKPIDHKTILTVLYAAFDKIGIPEEARNKSQRNITFHSWRYLLNSWCRGKLADSKLRLITGHKTEAMTDHYTQFTVEDFDDFAKIQERLVAG